LHGLRNVDGPGLDVDVRPGQAEQLATPQAEGRGVGTTTNLATFRMISSSRIALDSASRSTACTYWT
jgi:hypothetical protein